MGDIVVVDGVRYKRARAEKLGLLDSETPNTRAESEPAPSGLITSSVAGSKPIDVAEAEPTEPVSAETPAGTEEAAVTDQKPEGETPAEEVPAAEKSAGSDSTADTPKVTKARTPGSTRKG